MPQRFLFIVTLLAVLLAASPKLWAEKYAVLVGVNDYEHQKLREPRPLQYCVRDATVLGEKLAAQGYKITLLTEDTGKKDKALHPTKANIETQIQAVLRNCKKGDTVLVAFSGHGLQFGSEKDAFYCPIDARPFEDETATLVSLTKLYKDLDKSFAGVKVLLVDACRNDPTPGKGKGLDADSVPIPPRGVAALFSCSAGQRSFEHDRLKHGVFFHLILEGLDGKAADAQGEVTFDGLSAYVRKQVPQKVYELFPNEKPDQFPNLKADLVGAPPVLARVKLPDVGRSDPQPVAPGDKDKATLDLGGKVQLELVKIDAGEFQMGSELSAAEVARQFNSKAEYFEDEHPRHKVTIEKAFYLGKFEVTRGQFRQFINDSGYRTEAEKDGKGGYGWTGSEFKQSTTYSWRDAGFKQDDDHPVVNVSWNDAVAFCDWLSKKSGGKVRLPTEAQWEYAARGGKPGVFPWGNDPDDGAGWGNALDQTAKAQFDSLNTFSWRDGYVFTAPTGRFKANAFGVHDMFGNVLEWTSSKVESYPYRSTDGREEPGGTASRVLRGGCWYGNPAYCRSAYRYGIRPGSRIFNVGFRVVLDF